MPYYRATGNDVDYLRFSEYIYDTRGFSSSDGAVEKGGGKSESNHSRVPVFLGFFI